MTYSKRVARRVFDDVGVLRRCFFSFTLPSLEYCSVVWISAASCHLSLLDRVVHCASGCVVWRSLCCYLSVECCRVVYVLQNISYITLVILSMTSSLLPQDSSDILVQRCSCLDIERRRLSVALLTLWVGCGILCLV